MVNILIFLPLNFPKMAGLVPNFAFLDVNVLRGSPEFGGEAIAYIYHDVTGHSTI